MDSSGRSQGNRHGMRNGPWMAWETATDDASAYKPYACCSYIHPAIDAALKVRLDPAFSFDRIASIEIFVHPETLHVIAEPKEPKVHPHSIVDAQFSVFFAGGGGPEIRKLASERHLEALLHSGSYCGYRSSSACKLFILRRGRS